MPRVTNELQHKGGSGLYQQTRSADSSVASAIELKKLGDCVDTANNLLKVDIEDVTIGTEGLALESKQDTMINATVRDINNTGAIGDGSSQASAMCLGYDRTNGQGRSLLVDSTGALETNVTVNVGHGLATEAKQDDLINATNRAINNTDSIGDGSTNATAVALGYDRAGGKGRALLVDSDGHLQCDIVSGTVGVGDVRVKGNDGNDGAGTDRIIKTDANGVVIVDGSASTQPVSGTVAVSSVAGTVSVDGSGVTQPVSGTVAVSSVAGTVSVDGSGVTQPVSGTVTANAGSGTFAVSAAALPLPSGASVASKQPALGTAGTASTDVLSVQGIASMTPLVVDGSASTQPVSGTVAVSSVSGTVSVDGSGVTQPVSGTVTANAGSGTFAVSAASLPLPSGAATEATLALAEGHLGTIDTSTAGIVASHYQEGDSIGASDTGVLIMGRNGTNVAKPIHITNNGDVEVEIADFVKGQAAKAASFPVVIASDQDTLAVEASYSYGSELTLFSAQAIADGANATSATFEVQSVKVEDPIITFTLTAGGSTNYDVTARGSHDGSNFFNIGFAKSFFGDEMSSTGDMAVKVPRYMQFNIANNHGSGSHNFTMKAAGLGITLAFP
jgi:hypothetical protein